MKAAVVLAALILSAGIISSVVIYERAETARIARQEHQLECQKNKDALDRCLGVRRGTAEAAEVDLRVSKDCRDFWYPVIAEACK